MGRADGPSPCRLPTEGPAGATILMRPLHPRASRPSTVRSGTSRSCARATYSHRRSSPIQGRCDGPGALREIGRSGDRHGGGPKVRQGGGDAVPGSSPRHAISLIVEVTSERAAAARRGRGCQRSELPALRGRFSIRHLRRQPRASISGPWRRSPDCGEDIRPLAHPRRSSARPAATAVAPHRRRDGVQVCSSIRCWVPTFFDVSLPSEIPAAARSRGSDQRGARLGNG